MLCYVYMYVINVKIQIELIMWVCNMNTAHAGSKQVQNILMFWTFLAFPFKKGKAHPKHVQEASA